VRGQIRRGSRCGHLLRLGKPRECANYMIEVYSGINNETAYILMLLLRLVGGLAESGGRTLSFS